MTTLELLRGIRELLTKRHWPIECIHEAEPDYCDACAVVAGRSRAATDVEVLARLDEAIEKEVARGE